MNTWLVGKAPVGHFVHKSLKPSSGTEKDIQDKAENVAEKTFFMKVRMMAGQATLADNKLGLEDYKWLAKEEVQNEVHPSYWRAVKNMLVEI